MSKQANLDYTTHRKSGEKRKTVRERGRVAEKKDTAIKAGLAINPTKICGGGGQERNANCRDSAPNKLCNLNPTKMRSGVKGKKDAAVSPTEAHKTHTL